MHLHLAYTQFLSIAIALVAAAFLANFALAAFLDRRRNRKTPFLNYFHARFDQEQFDQDLPRRPAFIAREEGHTRNQPDFKALQVRETSPQDRRRRK